MASPALLQRDFTKMTRDFPRNQLPEGAVWNMVDWIPKEGAPLRGRGGWTNVADVRAVEPLSDRMGAGIHAPFTTPQNLVVDEDGRLWTFVAGNPPVQVAGLVYAALTPKQNPVFHADYVIFPSADGVAVPNRYNGTTIAPLGGSPPAGQYATVWKDYTLLANTAANPRRLFFSEPSDPNATWNTGAAGGIVDFSRPIRGLASLRNAILVFHDDAISRLRGEIPPPDGDLSSDDPLFQVGLADARSIVTHADYAYWCSTDGVYRSDGVALEDLTRRGDMSSYWQDLMRPFSASYTVAGGIIRDTYFVVVLDGLTPKDAFMIDLRTYGWTRISNVDAVTMWESVSLFDELYFGRRSGGVVGALSPLWNPEAANKLDGDGDPIVPVLETAFYEGKPGIKSWKRGYIGYQRTDFGADNPTLTVKAITTPEATAYSAALATLGEQTTYKRSRFDLHFASPGVAFKLECQASGDTLLYSLEAEVNPREPSRLTQ